MQYKISNLGPIKNASVELGDLTIVCGKNNTGKTYLTYTLNTFLDTIWHNLSLPLSPVHLKQLLKNGEIRVDLKSYINKFIEVIDRTTKGFMGALPRFLVMHPDKFTNTSFSVDITRQDVLNKFKNEKLENSKTTSDVEIVKGLNVFLNKSTKSTEVTLSILSKLTKIPSPALISKAISYPFANMFDCSLGAQLFPKPFIITCERTGASLFRHELVKTREMAHILESSQAELGFHTPRSWGYQRPVEKDIEFVLSLDSVSQRRSYISQFHPEILECLLSMTGGDYIVDSGTKTVKFLPKNSTMPLFMSESSSTVRSLSELYFYLAHIANKGQLFMFDEPELNLHPSSQRMLARLLIRLVNAGIKVFITTHSDYIVREINALIVISKMEAESRKRILDEFSIDEKEIPDGNKVRAYILEDGNLTSVAPSDGGSFLMRTFDNTLNEYMKMINHVMQYSYK